MINSSYVASAIADQQDDRSQGHSVLAIIMTPHTSAGKFFSRLRNYKCSTVKLVQLRSWLNCYPIFFIVQL